MRMIPKPLTTVVFSLPLFLSPLPLTAHAHPSPTSRPLPPQTPSRPLPPQRQHLPPVNCPHAKERAIDAKRAASASKSTLQPDPRFSKNPPPKASMHHHGHKHHKHPSFVGLPGIDPRTQRPFQTIDAYIRHLERGDRGLWQKPHVVLRNLGLRGDEIIADIGAGSGYFAFRFAQALPKGRVYAIDIEAEMVAYVQKRVADLKLSNLHTKLSTPDEPGLPKDADIVFLCNVLHHIAHPEAWLKKAFAQMKPGARLVILEFKKTPLPFGPPASMKLSPHAIQTMLITSGFVLRFLDTEALPYQDAHIAVKPADPN